MNGRLDLAAVPGLKLVEPGDDLAALIAAPARAPISALASGDVVVVAQKIVSKAEGRRVDLATVAPSPDAIGLADRDRQGRAAGGGDPARSRCGWCAPGRVR